MGLPVPHTELIPAKREIMAARVGTMVGDRVLTKDFVTQAGDDLQYIRVNGTVVGGLGRRRDLRALRLLLRAL